MLDHWRREDESDLLLPIKLKNHFLFARRRNDRGCLPIVRLDLIMAGWMAPPGRPGRSKIKLANPPNYSGSTNAGHTREKEEFDVIGSQDLRSICHRHPELLTASAKQCIYLEVAFCVFHVLSSSSKKI